MYKNNQSAKRSLVWFIICFVVGAVAGTAEALIQRYFFTEFPDVYTYKPFATLFVAIIMLTMSLYFFIRFLIYRYSSYKYVQIATVKGIKILLRNVHYTVDVSVNGVIKTVNTNTVFSLSRYATIDTNLYVGIHVKVGMASGTGKWVVL